MARKKRRGRPPGSTNKPKFAGSVATMDIGQLSSHIAHLRKVLADKIETQRDYLERQLAGLGVFSNGKQRAGSARGRVGRPPAGSRRKPEPKYQSKKNPRFKWTGRGVTPVWMREEMKGTKLKKDDFLIK